MKEFIKYTEQRFDLDNAQNLLFEMAAVAMAYGNRIIVEQDEEYGEKYIMVDFAPTDDSNAECEYDGEHVCWISSVDHEKEGKYFGGYDNYVEALDKVTSIMFMDGFTKAYVECY